MIQEYIYKGFMPINKETVIEWLKESIDFTKSILKYERLKDNKTLKIGLDTENNILITLETGIKYQDFTDYINEHISVCKSNLEYFMKIGNDYSFWEIEIKLYKGLLELLNNTKDYFKEQKGQLQLFIEEEEDANN